MSTLSHKRKLFKEKSLPKFKYKNRLLNVYSIKFVLLFLPKIIKIFDFIKKSNKNRKNKVRYENIKKQLKIIKSIIGKRFNYLKINKMFKLEILDDFYESLYGNNECFKKIFNRKNIIFKMIKLRKRKKFYVYKILKIN